MKDTDGKNNDCGIILAEKAGFCFGVKRAVNMLREEIKNNEGKKKIYTFGPIIHNKDVINEFASQGVEMIEDPEEIEKIKGQVLVIRAHGVSEEIYKTAEKNDVKVVDATCPYVEKIHRIVHEESRKGRTIVIAGDENHPEILGIKGWIDGKYEVIKDKKEANELNFEQSDEITLVFQTTFDINLFKDLVEIIRRKGYDTNVIDTICNATENRQREAALISESVDVMLVVGDISSANTKRLYGICRSNCKDTYFIQQPDDLDAINLQAGISVGITAGASTPDNIIQEVFLKCQKKRALTS